MKIENVIKKFNAKDMYLCPKCYKSATIQGISLKCEQGHAYDFSKKGYIHLIPNYKATKYNANLFSARSFVFTNGYYKHLLEELNNILAEYNGENIVDIGCGEGYYIKNLKEIFPEKYFYGLDNSKDAIESAVKGDKVNPYMLANLANLPFSDNSISAILNILTPANYEEFFRVLEPGGVLIKVIPTENYLKEIRELLGSSYTNSDTIKLIEDNSTLIKKKRVGKTFDINSMTAENFLQMTPLMFSRKITEELISSLTKITIELEIVVCRSK